MALFLLEPACKDYLWGGTKLRDDFGKRFGGEVLAESWELSCHPDGQSVIGSGPDRGMTLAAYLERQGPEALGQNCRRFSQFPVLVKLIDARQSLSVQVHPDDAYAARVENSFGKTEMWYIVDCEPGASLTLGFREPVSREEFARRIQDGTLTEVLQTVPVRPGDCFFIEAGTIHAIGAGIVIAEIQQSSNLTYRVYDYGRIGADGKPRELHVEKALEVTDRVPAKQNRNFDGHLALCPSFVVDHRPISGHAEETVGDDSFAHLLVLEGQGTIQADGEALPFGKGSSLFASAGTGRVHIEGDCSLLITKIPPLPLS